MFNMSWQWILIWVNAQRVASADSKFLSLVPSALHKGRIVLPPKIKIA
jgi:hypothetical protein